MIERQLDVLIGRVQSGGDKVLGDTRPSVAREGLQLIQDELLELLPRDRRGDLGLLRPVRSLRLPRPAAALLGTDPILTMGSTAVRRVRAAGSSAVPEGPAVIPRAILTATAIIPVSSAATTIIPESVPTSLLVTVTARALSVVAGSVTPSVAAARPRPLAVITPTIIPTTVLTPPVVIAATELLLIVRAAVPGPETLASAFETAVLPAPVALSVPAVAPEAVSG